MRNMKKYICSVLAVVFTVLMFSGVCFANDGMPVLKFDKDSYSAPPNNTISVTAHVTDPGKGNPMSGIKTTFSLKGNSGKETNLDTQTSDSNGLVTCTVPVENDFPYTLTGSASDGVNLVPVTITSSSEKSTDTSSKKATDTSSETMPTAEDSSTTILEDSSTSSDSVSTAESSSSNMVIWIVVLGGLLVVAVVVIIIVASKKKKDNKTE